MQTLFINVLGNNGTNIDKKILGTIEIDSLEPLITVETIYTDTEIRKRREYTNLVLQMYKHLVSFDTIKKEAEASGFDVMETHQFDCVREEKILTPLNNGFIEQCVVLPVFRMSCDLVSKDRSQNITQYFCYYLSLI